MKKIKKILENFVVVVGEVVVDFVVVFAIVVVILTSRYVRVTESRKKYHYFSFFFGS